MNNYSQLLEIHDTTYNKFKSSANPPNFVHMNLHDMKIQVAFLEEADWYGGRSVSVLSQNRKFPGKRNSLRVLLFVSTLQRDLFGRVEIQRRDPSTRAPRTRHPNSSRDPPFLVLSRLLRSEWLSSISSFYAYTLNFRLFLFLSNCLTLFLFTQTVCIGQSPFFRFTRTRWCSSLFYSLSLVFSIIRLERSESFFFYIIFLCLLSVRSYLFG